MAGPSLCQTQSKKYKNSENTSSGKKKEIIIKIISD